MTILLSDPRVAAIPVHDTGEPLVALDAGFGPARALVRSGLAGRLTDARDLLPRGVALRVVEGHHLTSCYVSPVDVAPHVAGAAVDLTLVDGHGAGLDLGTPIDATPEVSGGRCYLDAADLTSEARARRDLLASVLCAVGLVNYPTEWWHWSYGDRYWALLNRSPAALYGPVQPARGVA